MSEYEEVNREEVENFAKEYKLTLCSTSAKDNTGIQVIYFIYIFYYRKCLGR